MGPIYIKYICVCLSQITKLIYNRDLLVPLEPNLIRFSLKKLLGDKLKHFAYNRLTKFSKSFKFANTIHNSFTSYIKFIIKKFFHRSSKNVSANLFAN